jgi:hypothetical protein
MVVIDVPHVFRVCGGPRGLLDALDEHQPGHGLAYATVQMWSTRSAIPSRYIGAVLYCLEREDHHCSEFLVEPEELL